MKYLLLAALLALPPLASSQAIPFEQDPVISLTGSANFIYGEREGGRDHNLWGWTLTPEVNITPRIGMQVDFSNFTENSISPAQHRLILTAGPRFSFAPVYRTRPYIYAEAGEMRETFQGSAYRNWDPVAKVGVGFDYHMMRDVSLNIVPFEYLAHNLDAGGWNNDYSAHVGFTVHFFPKPPRRR